MPDHPQGADHETPFDRTRTMLEPQRGPSSGPSEASPVPRGLSGSRYRVLRPHAKGGLGEVFVAQDEELHREVALKEIQPQHAGHADHRARFVLEAEVTGGLEHPGIVPVYGLGEYADGRPFYAMRFIRGESLAEAIRRFHDRGQAPRLSRQGSLDLRKLLERFNDVCNAIAYAHDRGVLHRDLKPGNIMLGPYGETLVVDWGLAKSVGRPEAASTSGEATLHPSSASGSTPTQLGAVIGTPAYMSPEQAAGKLDELGPASDVYSLGATLYCLLVGRAPFTGSDLEVLLEQVRQGRVMAPRQVASHVPHALNAVCLKAMALRPHDRYATPRELADDIDRWLADEPVYAYSEPLLARVGRWGRKHRTTVTALAVLVVTALAGVSAGLVAVGREKARTEEARDRAQELAVEKTALATAESQARRRADAQARLAVQTLESVVFDMQRGLDGIPGAQRVQRNLLQTALTGLRRVSRTLESTAAAADRNQMVAHQDLGEVFLTIGDAAGADATAEADRHFAAALAIAERLADASPGDTQAQRDLALSLNKTGDTAVRLGKIDSARQAYERSLAIRQRLLQGAATDADAQRDVASSYERLGDVRLRQGDAELARQAYQQCLEYRQALAALAPPGDRTMLRDLSVAHNKLGDVELQLGDSTAARIAYERGLALIEQLLTLHPESIEAERDFSVSCNKLGDILLRLKDLDGALRAYERGQAIRERLAKDDPNNAEAQRSLSVSQDKIGDVRMRQNNLAAARRAYETSLEIRQRLATADPSSALARADLCVAGDKLGDVLMKQEAYDDARRVFERGLAIREELARADASHVATHVDLARSHGLLGTLEGQVGNLEEARTHLEAALGLLRPLAAAGKLSTADRGLLEFLESILGVLPPK